MKNKIATPFELQAIPYRDNRESLVTLGSNSPIRSEYRRTDSGLQSVLIRQSVFNKLQNIQKKLSPPMQLLVVEGYRPFAYQEQYYLKEFRAQLEADPFLEFNALVEQTHQLVALPSVSGHPTGGAIDITLAYDGKEIDMGGEIAHFSQPHLLPTYSQFITPEQSKWRMLLHHLMIEEGFAAFYGEWWHFSYGDREWAAFYEQPEAIYSHLG